MLSRRLLLKMLAASQSSAFLSPVFAETSTLSFGQPLPFDFEILKKAAAQRAETPYVPPPAPDPTILARIDYDTFRTIKFDIGRALYGNGPYPITFMTGGSLFLKSVMMHSIDGDVAREILFSPDYFKHPSGSPFEELKAGPPPFAGFEIRNSLDERRQGWASFLGASYFRAVSEADQYGLSARGVAQNSGGAPPEEFPDFTHFWIGEGKANGDPVEVYALLDGPSIVGAYRFLIHRDRGTLMDVTCRLHLRKPIERLGIAPLTSMFWFSETVQGAGVDWRPEVHDSDGLAILTGHGERIWRPLNDPSSTNISLFEDENPRGFGLMQRDKSYDHYLDEVRYHRRPCGWVEPVGRWGKGSVQLVENPTDNEIYDNIVAMWVPAERTKAGQTLDYRYKLHWTDQDPFTEDLALCVATRLGKGGKPGALRSDVLRLFVVEFKGAALGKLARDQAPEAILASSGGHFLRVSVEPSADGTRDLWRARFELDPQLEDVTELSCFLSKSGQRLTETWRFRYVRFISPVR